MLAEKDQKIVQRDPVPSGELRPQGGFRFRRGSCSDVPPPVRDSMNVGVDTNGRNAEPDAQYEVRRLSADSRKAKEGVEIGRDLRAMLADQGLADSTDVPRLGPVKPDRIDGARDPFPGEAQHFLWGSGEAKQSFCGGVGRLVLGPLAEQATDEQSERLSGLAYLRERGLPPGEGFPLEDRQNR